MGGQSHGLSPGKHSSARPQLVVAVAVAGGAADSRSVVRGFNFCGASGRGCLGGLDCRAKEYALDGVLSGQFDLVFAVRRKVQSPQSTVRSPRKEGDGSKKNGE